MNPSYLAKEAIHIADEKNKTNQSEKGNKPGQGDDIEVVLGTPNTGCF